MLYTPLITPIGYLTICHYLLLPGLIRCTVPGGFQPKHGIEDYNLIKQYIEKNDRIEILHTITVQEGEGDPQSNILSGGRSTV